jgi:heat shock protein HslJ
MKLKYLVSVSLAMLAVALFAACAARDPLAGSAWQLAAFGNTPPLEGTRITATFKDGQVGGSAGCNSYGGEYTLKGGKIAFGALAMTEMACLEPQGAMEQEAMYLEWLGAAERFELKGGQLLVYRADGEALTFVPQE